MANVDYSRVAALYRWLEFAVFGSRLQSARVAFLGDVLDYLEGGNTPRCLVVGDGDGRFLKELLDRVGEIHVDYVDCSEGMMRQAQQRVGEDSRVNWICCELEEWDGGEYSMIAAHFFLDGYDAQRKGEVVKGLSERIQRGGLLMVSDFDPSARFWSPLLLRVMQLFFYFFAKLPRVEVARDDQLLEGSGLLKVGEKLWQKGWIYSQLWKIC